MDRQDPRHQPLNGRPEKEQSQQACCREWKQGLLRAQKFVGGLPAGSEGEEVEQRSQQPDQQRESRQDAAGDQGEDARRRMPLAEIGEHVEGDDDADEGNDVEIGLEVRPDGQQRQDFAGGVGPWGLPCRMSISCCTRSIGTGKTITVFRSTPISVRVCK